MVFKVGKSKVKDKWKLKGHNLKKSTKRQGISLKLHRNMGNIMIGIVKHYPYQNKQIKVFKRNHPPKGGRVLERVNQLGGFLKESGETKWLKTWHTIRNHPKQREYNHQMGQRIIVKDIWNNRHQQVNPKHYQSISSS